MASGLLKNFGRFLRIFPLIIWHKQYFVGFRIVSGFVFFFLMAVFTFASSSQIKADNFFSDSALIGIYTGSKRSSLMKSVRSGTYELSNGEPVSFAEWYTPKLPEINVVFLKPTSDAFGLIWGAGSGEYAEKYKISPSIHLGMLYRHRITDNMSLNFRGVYILGGWLREKTCTADYGEIGGVQVVNCRLAATTLAPEDTLEFLIKERGEIDSYISFDFTLRF